MRYQALMDELQEIRSSAILSAAIDRVDENSNDGLDRPSADQVLDDGGRVRVFDVERAVVEISGFVGGVVRVARRR